MKPGNNSMKPDRRTVLKTAVAAGALQIASSFVVTARAADVVKIGVLTDMSSLYADLSGPGAVAAVKMAAADFGGSVLGKKIEIISADHQNKPDVASAIARQWFDQGVDMITDLTTSSVALAVQEVAREKNKVILINGAASSDLTGKNCSPTSVHWTYDTTALANGTGSAVVKAGGKTWFFITADYALRPLPSSAIPPRSSRRMAARCWATPWCRSTPLISPPSCCRRRPRRRKIIGLANAGGDTINSIKQATEFGITEGGQKLRGPVDLPHRCPQPRPQDGAGAAVDLRLLLGPERHRPAPGRSASTSRDAQGADNGPGRRLQCDAQLAHRRSRRRTASMPLAVMKELRSTSDKRLHDEERSRPAGRPLVRDMYLFEVKKPSESNGEWDLYKPVGTIPGAVAFRRPGGNACPLVKS